MKPVHVWRSPRALTVAALLAALAVGFAVSAVVFRADGPWDPLGEYPVQRVDSRDLADVAGPSVKAPGVVRVTATKCAKQQTDVIGHSGWQRVDPLGRVIETGAGTATRIVGCNAVDYTNDVPQEVITATQAVGGRAVWRIVGDETPVAPDGSRGEPRVWQTQTFTIQVEG